MSKIVYFAYNNNFLLKSKIKQHLKNSWIGPIIYSLSRYHEVFKILQRKSQFEGYLIKSNLKLSLHSEK